jgi:hypothetical protein
MLRHVMRVSLTRRKECGACATSSEILTIDDAVAALSDNSGLPSKSDDALGDDEALGDSDGDRGGDGDGAGDVDGEVDREFGTGIAVDWRGNGAVPNANEYVGFLAPRQINSPGATATLALPSCTIESV